MSLAHSHLPILMDMFYSFTILIYYVCVCLYVYGSQLYVNLMCVWIICNVCLCCTEFFYLYTPHLPLLKTFFYFSVHLTHICFSPYLTPSHYSSISFVLWKTILSHIPPPHPINLLSPCTATHTRTNFSIALFQRLISANNSVAAGQFHCHLPCQ